MARLAGYAFGYGIRADIRDAYIFIMNHWKPGDRLFLLGFSRGAYTVRALASLLKLYGMIMPGNEALVPYMVRMLWRMRSSGSKKFGEQLKEARRFKASLSVASCHPHFMGVWDTVSSVGWFSSPVALPYTRENQEVKTVRHAVSYDERRSFFRSNLFKQASGQDLIQLWFPGNHCDVGGGHPETESGMSKYPFGWVVREAAKAGMLIHEARLKELLGLGPDSQYAPATPTAKLHRMPWYWWPAEILPKKHWNSETRKWGYRWNLARRRSMPEKPLFHSVAWEVPEYAKHLPHDVVKYTS